MACNICKAPATQLVMFNDADFITFTFKLPISEETQEGLHAKEDRDPTLSRVLMCDECLKDARKAQQEELDYLAWPG